VAIVPDGSSTLKKVSSGELKAAAKENATRTLVHYIEQLYRQAGIGWDSQAEREVSGIVVDIITAAS